MSADPHGDDRLRAISNALEPTRAKLAAIATQRREAAGPTTPRPTQQVVRPVIRSTEIHALPDLEPVGPSRLERMTTWAQVFGLPVSILAVVVAIVVR